MLPALFKVVLGRVFTVVKFQTNKIAGMTHAKKTTAYFYVYLIALIVFFSAGFSLMAAENAKKQNSPPPVPVRVAKVEIRSVSDQISLVGTAEAIAKSTIASEVSGIVE